MRKAVEVLLCMLCTVLLSISGVPGALAAVVKPTKSHEPAKADIDYSRGGDCKNADLFVIGKSNAPEFKYQLGDTLYIGIDPARRGEFEQLTKPENNLPKLMLDDVEMSGLQMALSDSFLEKDKGPAILAVVLARDSNVKESREAWDKFLRKQSNAWGDFTVEPRLAVSIPGKIPSGVCYAKPFQFSVHTDGRIRTTFWVLLFVFVVAFLVLKHYTPALRDAPDGRYSLGKSQLAFWMFLVATSFVGVWIVTGSMERIPTQVWILLGISGTTGLFAAYIGSSEEERAAVQKKLGDLRTEAATLEAKRNIVPPTFTPDDQATVDRLERKIKLLNPDKSDGFFTDICNDGTGWSVHRLQVVIWTLILGAVFVRSVVHVISMPEFPQELLWLMGLSSGTYLGFKKATETPK
jgi:hypothetical protein